VEGDQEPVLTGLNGLFGFLFAGFEQAGHSPVGSLFALPDERCDQGGQPGPVFGDLRISSMRLSLPG
jgi:hypothetical protein